MRGPIVVVGDTLLDRDVEGRVERICPDAPVPVVDADRDHARPGGAGLAAVLAADGDRDVVLVTALGGDDAGETVAALLADRGVEVVDLGLRGTTPEKVRVRADGRSLLRLDRGGEASAVGECSPEAATAIAGASAVLVADYGRGITSEPGVRAALRSSTAFVWDPHPRGAAPVPGARLATPNAKEAAALVPGVEGDGFAAHTARARELADRWQAAAVAVTLGRAGALLATGDVPPLVVPADPADGDPCGAGDCFAAAATTALAAGALPSEAVVAAVAAASSFVAAGGAFAALAPPDPLAGRTPSAGEAAALDLIGRVRARDGTVVATGGCFDLLHAGHVSVLQAARALGDCLVVCLNSDASVRRQKGEGRPFVPEGDRAAVLLALGCVDGVVLFDEDTPLALLDRLRPDIFAKGADYAVADLPEAALLAEWGGQAVVLPYLSGRSTSRLAQEVLARSAR
ncbi:MAG TPA: PfkB family carbohydrate kinase [Acidimicrobiales bacterium]|nr:PfkB family carbohydrate kinase [Acidimicrobiales bacterium]